MTLVLWRYIKYSRHTTPLLEHGHLTKSTCISRWLTDVQEVTYQSLLVRVTSYRKKLNGVPEVWAFSQLLYPK